MLNNPIATHGNLVVVKTSKPKFRQGHKRPVSSSFGGDLLHQLELNWNVNAKQLKENANEKT